MTLEIIKIIISFLLIILLIYEIFLIIRVVLLSINNALNYYEVFDLYYDLDIKDSFYIIRNDILKLYWISIFMAISSCFVMNNFEFSIQKSVTALFFGLFLIATKRI